MKKYEVQIRNEVKRDIDQIKDFIVNKTSREHAERYAADLYTEIRSLAFLADSIKVSEWAIAKKFSRSKREKVLLTNNKKWSIFFHTYRDKVIIDKILASKLIVE
ncbi:MAG: hypothetical protein IKT08_03665 [Bacteroidales bacterium]|nr:hypothetical protein [Bacteroidales bacterium]